MARLTAERDALVVRLVYDGPPRSGKTTSLGALAAGMARSVFSPAEEEGRTLYFDWLEYIGGSFDGIPIRCQILSAPGQPELVARRRALLAEADSVVFVTNSTDEHLPEASLHLQELRAWLAEQPCPRPGVVLQANHRDVPAALPMDRLRSALDLDGLAVVESVAIENHGVRQAFVLAVRLALDRARELQAQGELPQGAGATDDPGSLLTWIQSVPLGEGAAGGPAPKAAVVPQDGSGVPRLPDGSTPSGRVWPPIEGRIVLHSAVLPEARPRRGPDGSWHFRRGDWYVHSANRHEFEALDDAKQELLRWARGHAGGLDRLTPHRCLALADTGLGTWRLWQVLRFEESFEQTLRSALQSSGPDEIAQRVRRSAELLRTACDEFQLPLPLPCRLEVLGEAGGRPVYVGLLPPADWVPSPGEYPPSTAALVRREIEPLLEAMRPRPPVVEAALAAALAGS